MKVFPLLLIPIGIAMADGLKKFPDDYSVSEQRDEYKAKAEYFEKRTNELEEKYESLDSEEAKLGRFFLHQINIRIFKVELLKEERALTNEELDYLRSLQRSRERLISEGVTITKPANKTGDDNSE